MTKDYKIGQRLKVKVTGIEEYGIFVYIDEETNGLIHISEITESFVRNVGDYVTLNETIYAEIIAIDYKNHHVRLSIKNLNYRIENIKKYQEESKGFQPLKENLPKWTKEKLAQLEIENTQ